MGAGFLHPCGLKNIQLLDFTPMTEMLEICLIYEMQRQQQE
jgi:hypothetical protein